MFRDFAHAGEAHEAAEASSGLLDAIAHQPVWIAFLISVFVLISWFAILGLFRIKLVSKLLALLPAVMALALLFFEHNPIVASILLSGGFILVFALAFTMLRVPPKKK